MRKSLRFMAVLVLIFSLLAIPVSALSVEDARNLLEEYYIDDLPPEAAQAQTLDELLSLLNDPYTVYMPEQEHKEFVDGINDTKLVGIGVSIEVHEKGIFISSVLDDSPALEAGLTTGDIIQAVNGIPLTDTEQARSLLSGDIGTAVTITVLRADGTVTDFELIRREITVPTTAQYELSEDGNACVIVTTSFGNETPDHVADAIKEYDATVNGFILDLSTNPGGTSTSGAATAGCFIGEATMLHLRDGQDQYAYTFTRPGTPLLTQKGVIALTGPYSASSSELFLGAIRDHSAGIAIGQRTLGKGVAQLLLDETNFPELFDGDALKITVYRFFSPHGTTNDKIGVMPTLLMSLDNTYYAALLLCGDYTGSAEGQLKLTLSDQIYYIDLATAMSEEFRPAFVELLEALPLSAQLRCDDGTGKYTNTTPRAVAHMLGLSEYAPRTFSDLSETPYADAINTMTIYGMLGGYGDGTFRPNLHMTRAEFCAMLANMLDLNTESVTQSTFPDVSPDSWYAPVVHAMQADGLLSGYEDGFFRPNDTISQQEVVSILAKLSTRLNMYAYNRRNLSPTEDVMAEFAHFSDWAQHPAWLLDSCEVDLSALTSPQDPITRGEAADLLCQLLTRTKVLWP